MADVVLEAGWVVDVGPGLDGDESVDAAGATVLPGPFDCHVHLGFSHLDLGRAAFEPFALTCYSAVAAPLTTLRLGITTCGTPASSTAGCGPRWRPG